MMLSAEERWFWRGAPPAAFEEWFLGDTVFEYAAIGISEHGTWFALATISGKYQPRWLS